MKNYLNKAPKIAAHKAFHSNDITELLTMISQSIIENQISDIWTIHIEPKYNEKLQIYSWYCDLYYSMEDLMKDD